MTKKKTTDSKSSDSGFSSFKKEMDNTPRLPRENFRQYAERIGVPSGDVAEFKHWLTKSN